MRDMSNVRRFSNLTRRLTALTRKNVLLPYAGATNDVWLRADLPKSHNSEHLTSAPFIFDVLHVVFALALLVRCVFVSIACLVSVHVSFALTDCCRACS
jgi:hypothetical protein